MAVYKESGTNTWRAIYRYTDWQGERKQTSKRGFPCVTFDKSNKTPAYACYSTAR